MRLPQDVAVVIVCAATAIEAFPSPIQAAGFVERAQ